MIHSRVGEIGVLAAGNSSVGGWSTVWIGAAAVLLVAAGVLFWRWRRRDATQEVFNPRKLFTELCAAHGLTSVQQRLLVSIASQQRLSNPARLFLEVDRWQDDQLGPLLKRQRPEIEALRQRLYGGNQPAAAKSA